MLAAVVSLAVGSVAFADDPPSPGSTTPAHHATHPAHHHGHGHAPTSHSAHHPHAAAVAHAVKPPIVPRIVAVPPVPPDKGTNTGLPLPRFASLRADDVNMRSGPGDRYPIQWVYKRRALPVEIEREFDVWRLVEDSDGVRGWMHQATLVGTRTFVVTAAGPVTIGGVARGIATALRADPRDDARIVAILRPGVIGRLRVCPAASGWCRVTSHNYSGWLPRSAVFGLLPNEVITPP